MSRDLTRGVGLSSGWPLKRGSTVFLSCLTYDISVYVDRERQHQLWLAREEQARREWEAREKRQEWEKLKREEEEVTEFS